MERHRPSPIALALSLAGLFASALVGCSSEPDQPPALPSSLLPSATPTAIGSSGGPTGGSSGGTATGSNGVTSDGGSGTTGALPTGPTGEATGTLSRGGLSIRVTGQLRAENTLRDLISATYSPPPGGIALVWTAGGTDATTVGIGGASFVGSQPTAPTLTMTITVPSADGSFETFVSFAGECTITLNEASANRIAGSFRCSSLRSSSGVVVDATGIFSASG